MFVSEKSRLEAGEMSNGKGNSIGLLYPGKVVSR